MSVVHRVNKKTGANQYSVRYYWRDENGKLKGSQTGWFPTVSKAQKKADELKAAKESDSALKITNKREAYIYTVFGYYVKELEDRKDRVTTDKTSNDHFVWSKARTIYNHYIPDDIKYTKVNEITVRIFRMWADRINDTHLAGSTIEKYLLVLFRFNRYLANKGYYTDSSLEMNIDTMLSRFNAKDRNIGVRKDRYLLGMDDVETLTHVWRDKGLGNFYNFQYYTLWYTFAYTGMRVEELRALQWKFVDLHPSVRVISIENAISDGEKRSNALERTNKGIYYTKTSQSVRGIPIFNFIYTLLKDYRESYMYEFNLTEEDINDCFVFPRQNRDGSFNPHDYARREIWLTRLKETINQCGLPNTDLGMFRHATATFLVAPEPEGLGMSEEEVMTFFGHTTTLQLKNTYAKLQVQQKTRRLKAVFSKYFTPDENEVETNKSKAKKRMIERVAGDNEVETYNARRDRIWLQIIHTIVNNKKVYYYSEEDESIITELKPKLKNYDVELIKK